MVSKILALLLCSSFSMTAAFASTSTDTARITGQICEKLGEQSINIEVQKHTIETAQKALTSAEHYRDGYLILEGALVVGEVVWFKSYSAKVKAEMIDSIGSGITYIFGGAVSLAADAGVGVGGYYFTIPQLEAAKAKLNQANTDLTTQIAVKTQFENELKSLTGADSCE